MQALDQHIARDGFRLRGIQSERLDAFSDVVFGFALTLLVVSLEVPKTYPELLQTLRGFFPFAISFLLLMRVWYTHYTYFRRFGTHDFGTVLINSLLLFVILFFVYPLKFLFSFVALTISGQGHVFTDIRQLAHLMVIYGIGFASIYSLFSGLYLNAYRQRGSLQLTPLERLLTRHYIFETASTSAIGLTSCVLALLLSPKYAGTAAYLYLLIWPVHAFGNRRLNRKRAALPHQQHSDPLPAPEPA